MSKQAADQSPKTVRGVALMPTLLASIGLLVLLAVGSLLALQWITGRGVIDDFADRIIARGLATEERSVRDNLQAAVSDATFIADALKAGRYGLFGKSFEDFAIGTLAAAPQIGGLVVIAADGKALRLVRGPQPSGYKLDYTNSVDDARLTNALKEAAERRAPYWGPPVFARINHMTYLDYRVPVFAGPQYLGVVAVTISTEALSRLAAELSHPPRSLSFMLYGRNWMLAHPRLMNEAAGRSEKQPMVRIADFGDPVLEDLYHLPPLDILGIKPPPGAHARQALVGGKRYLVFTHPIDYSELPITVGSYTLASAVDAPLRLFYWGMIIAVAMLALALVGAGLLARTIARPIRRAATGAATVGELDFDKVSPLSPSYIREISDLSHAFNAMLDGLKAFGRYVPRGLVNRLIKEGRVGAGSEQRTLAIMFTDIAGFTSACENMTADEVASFINHHLSLVGHCIESEGGTIDKYIGDAVMAFWGAPVQIDNPAAHACRAALAIKRAVAADNAERKVSNLAPVRVRIGIHLGPVVVGDIGAPQRINYTIVGDAVNAAQRLESLGKTVDPDAETITLISAAVADELPVGFNLLDKGRQSVKGKHETLQVFELASGD